MFAGKANGTQHLMRDAGALRRCFTDSDFGGGNFKKQRGIDDDRAAAVLARRAAAPMASRSSGSTPSGASLTTLARNPSRLRALSASPAMLVPSAMRTLPS